MTIFTKHRKYSNQPVTIDGIRYDSKAEARYAQELQLRMRAREVTQVEHQVPFALVGPDGMLLTTYRADFVFYDMVEGRTRIIDVKGGKATQTDMFRLKKKMMKSLLGLEVEVVEL